MNAIHTEEYKGFNIEIHQDVDSMPPDEWGDTGLFLVSGHPQIYIQHDLIKVDPRRHSFEGKQKVKLPTNRRVYHVFKLYGYSHSGEGLSLSNDHYPFNCPWDGFYTGTVYASSKEFKTREKAREVAQSLIEEWNDYLSGNVWGFQVFDNEDECVDSCWGYNGVYALSEAKKRVDSLVAESVGV